MLTEILFDIPMQESNLLKIFAIYVFVYIFSLGFYVVWNLK